MMRHTVLVGCLAALTASAGAQSATVTLSSAAGSVSPGDTVTVSIDVTFDTAGASGGVFGTPGFYGFGGDVTSSSADASGANPVIDSALSFGATASAQTGSSVLRAAAGRGLMGGISGPVSAATFDVVIDSAASDGDITLDFDGAVVLALGDTLATYATSPGVNQNALTVNPLVLSVASASRLCADQNNDGVVNGLDFGAWLGNFNAADPLADVNQDGSVNGLDFGAWLGAFNQGVNGPTCP